MATSSFYQSSGSSPAAENTIDEQVTAAQTAATTAQTASTQATTSATSAASSLTSFQTYYLGAFSVTPTTTQQGAMYFDLSTNQLKIWSGSAWEITASTSSISNTNDVPEGTSNLYFTDERVDDRVNGLLVAGSNVTLTYDDAANTLTIASTGGGGGSSTFVGLSDTPANYTGQANRYLMVNATEDAVTTVTPSTDDIAEGSSNLYFTNARASSAITGSDLDMGGNKVLFGNVYSAESDLPSASTYHGMFAHVHGTGKGYFAHAGSWHKLLDETSSTTTDLTEGSNLYFTDERVDDRVNALLTAGSNITLTYDDAANTLTIASTASGGGSGGSSTFTGLTDTPSSFTASKFVAVNSGGTALEYATALTPSNLTVTSNAASGGGAISYVPGANGATLSYTPPDLTSYIDLTDISVTTAPASGGGNLAYNNATGQFTFTPANLSGSGGIGLTDLSATNATASGGGSLAYNNTTGAFTLTPPDLSSYATTASLSNYATTASLATVATSGAYGDLSGTPSLATVATSGAYGDLSGTPNLSGYATATSTTTFTNKSGNISQWTNDSGYLTGITGESLYSLSNVYTSSSPTDGQVLTWDNANSYWKPTTVSSGTTINYLASTSTSAATTNSKPKSLALGSGATVGTNVTDNGIAIGHNATLDMGYSIMIGNDQNADYQSTIIAAHENSLSSGAGQTCTIVGDNYKVTGVNRSGVTLLGSGTAGTNYSTALGYQADAQHSYAVALGFGATTTQGQQLMLGDSNWYDGFTSIRVGYSGYVPSNAMDLTTKSYVDGLAPTTFTGSTATSPVNLFNLGAHANYDGGEIVIIADTGSAKQIAKIIFTHQSGAPVFTTYAQITTGTTSQFATFSIIQSSTNLVLRITQTTGGTVTYTAKVTYV